jgi:hypothetical protein
MTGHQPGWTDRRATPPPQPITPVIPPPQVDFEWNSPLARTKRQVERHEADMVGRFQATTTRPEDVDWYLYASARRDDDEDDTPYQRNLSARMDSTQDRNTQTGDAQRGSTRGRATQTGDARGSHAQDVPPRDPSEPEPVDVVIEITNVGLVTVRGYRMMTPTGEVVIIAGTLETEDPDRRIGGWTDIRNVPLVPVNEAAMTPYLDFIARNREALLSVATRRLAEMRNTLAALPEDVRANIPPYAWDGLISMTPEEYAARMVSVPFTMNVPGWLNDFGRVGIAPNEPQFYTPEVTAATLGTGLVPGDIQSAGYLELRQSQFDDLVNTRSISIGGVSYEILDSPLEIEVVMLSSPPSFVGGGFVSVHSTITRDETFGQYLEGSLPLGSQGVVARLGGMSAYNYSDALRQSGIPLAENVNEQVIAEAMGTRFLMQNLQYIDAWQEPNLTRNFDPSDSVRYWHLTSPEAYAINAARAGWWSEGQRPYGVPSGEGSDRWRGYYTDWSARYDNIMIYSRGVFGSNQSSTSPQG